MSRKGKISLLAQELQTPRGRFAVSVFGRYVLLLPIAIAMAIAAIGEGQNVRILALLALVVLFQIREWWTVREITAGKK